MRSSLSCSEPYEAQGLGFAAGRPCRNALREHGVRLARWKGWMRVRNREWKSQCLEWMSVGPALREDAAAETSQPI
jgi:hypothetical protein